VYNTKALGRPETENPTSAEQSRRAKALLRLETESNVRRGSGEREGVGKNVGAEFDVSRETVRSAVLVRQ